LPLAGYFKLTAYIIILSSIIKSLHLFCYKEGKWA
jgi:hypothetical protein